MLKIGEVQRVFSASPTYLAEMGQPHSPAEMHSHQRIMIEDEVGMHFADDRDAGRSGRTAPRLSVNSVQAGIDAAIAGLGIIETLSYQVADHLQAGRLKRIQVDAKPLALPVHLLFQSALRNTPNIRAFAELVQTRLICTRTSARSPGPTSFSKMSAALKASTP